MSDQLLRIPEAAVRLGVSKRKMFQLLSLGVFERVYLPHMKSPRVLLSAVDAAISKAAGNIVAKRSRNA